MEKQPITSAKYTTGGKGHSLYRRGVAVVSRSAVVLVAMLLVSALMWTTPSAAADSQSVRTQSGKVRCLVDSNDVAHGGGPLVVCEYNSGFPQAPSSSGAHWNLAVVRGDGTFNWDVGNIGGSPEALASDIVLNYGQTYRVNGWTILPSFDGTRFTDDRTGHGMFVSIDNVYSF